MFRSEANVKSKQAVCNIGGEVHDGSNLFQDKFVESCTLMRIAQFFFGPERFAICIGI